MRNIISFMHVSLDGFVAGPKGEMSWININEEIFDHVGKRISKGDTALYGRITYEMMEHYWPTAADKPNATKHDIEHSKWYSKVHKIVLSKNLKTADTSPSGGTNPQIIRDHLLDQINAIKNNGDKEILVFGSPTATHSLMELDLIDGYWLFVNPIILGQGIPLFKYIKNKTSLKLLTSKSFPCGVMELSYTVNK